MVCHLFQREEVQFMHDNEDFVYRFDRFDSGKIAFRQLKPIGLAQEVDIYPNGKMQFANTAVIVLFKAATSGQPLKGFLPDVLRTMLDLYVSKDAMIANLSKTITSFQAKTPIAFMEDVIRFVDPYAPWTVNVVGCN